jgi:AraC family transcriptional regulator
MSLHNDGARKYGAKGLLHAFTPLSRRGLAAELRHHPAGEIPEFKPRQLEIGIAIDCHPECVVSRRGDGLRQRTQVDRGTIWLCPPGVLEQDIQISAWHDVLHIYLPSERFAQAVDTAIGKNVDPESIRYLGGLYDEVIQQAGRGLVDEMRTPTSAGQVRVETVAEALVVRIADRYAGGGAASGILHAQHAIDERRLRRVLDYMMSHLEDDIGLAELSEVACLSRFHFIRMFSARMGMPPHRYLGFLRLERAKTLLAVGDQSIAEISLICCFSSQSNFSRAFRRATSVSPLDYRHATTSRTTFV